MPIVKSVIVDSVNVDSYAFSDVFEDDEAYVVKAIVEYEKDLDYPTEITLVLVHNENKLEVAKMS